MIKCENVQKVDLINLNLNFDKLIFFHRFYHFVNFFRLS